MVFKPTRDDDDDDEENAAAAARHTDDDDFFINRFRGRRRVTREVAVDLFSS